MDPRMSCHARARLLSAVAALLLFLSCGEAVFAGETAVPVVVDAADAVARSQREGRDPVEGRWAIYIDRAPVALAPGASRSFRLAVARNTYGVYAEWEYVGVATCNRPGCARGEVKLLLSRTARPGVYRAVLLAAPGAAAEGEALLVVDEERNRPDSVLDMRAVLYEGQVVAKWMVRVMGG